MAANSNLNFGTPFMYIRIGRVSWLSWSMTRNGFAFRNRSGPHGSLLCIQIPKKNWRWVTRPRDGRTPDLRFALDPLRNLFSESVIGPRPTRPRQNQSKFGERRIREASFRRSFIEFLVQGPVLRPTFLNQIRKSNLLSLLNAFHPHPSFAR